MELNKTVRCILAVAGMVLWLIILILYVCGVMRAFHMWALWLLVVFVCGVPCLLHSSGKVIPPPPNREMPHHGAITVAEPMKRHTLHVAFADGTDGMLDMRACISHRRFEPLQSPKVWLSADTNGSAVRWYKRGKPVAMLREVEILWLLEGHWFL